MKRCWTQASIACMLKWNGFIVYEYSSTTDLVYNSIVLICGSAELSTKLIHKLAMNSTCMLLNIEVWPGLDTKS